MVVDTTKTDNELKAKEGIKGKNLESEVEYDELLSSAGELGRYQILLFIATCPFYFVGVVVYYGQVFLTQVSPKYWCNVPELMNLTEEDRIALAIPPDENARYGIDQCYQYVANWTQVIAEGLRPNTTWPIAPCENGWEFDLNGIPYATIASEQGWVCSKGSYQASAQAINFAGSILGGFLIGWISDRYGRIPAVVSSCLFGCIGGVTSIFASSFAEFAVCRFIVGIAYDNSMMMAYLIVLEYVAPKYRSLLSNMAFAIFYCFFCVVLPWIALAVGYWKIFALVTSIPLAFAVLTPLFLPESPRWLLSKGRVDEAIEKVLTIGRINKKDVPVKLIKQFKSTVANQKPQPTVSCIEIFKKPGLRKTFILMCLLYMCSTIVFDALVRNISQLDFNYFVSFTLISLTELPSMVLVAFILDKIGRRWLTAMTMTVACVFCILSVFIGSTTGSVICALIARFGVNIAFSAAIQWTPEVLPTAVRGSGAAVVHICGFVATMLSPYIVYLQIFLYWLPSVIIGAIAVCGGVLALFIPETAGVDMPQTFEDAVLLSEKQSFWDIPCLRKKNEKCNCNGNFNSGFEM